MPGWLACIPLHPPRQATALCRIAPAIEDQAEKLRYATTLDVIGALSEGELQAQGIETVGKSREFGARNQELGFLAEAGFQRANRGYYRRSGYFGAGSSIATGVGSTLLRLA